MCDTDWDPSTQSNEMRRGWGLGGGGGGGGVCRGYEAPPCWCYLVCGVGNSAGGPCRGRAACSRRCAARRPSRRTARTAAREPAHLCPSARKQARNTRGESEGNKHLLSFILHIYFIQTLFPSPIGNRRTPWVFSGYYRPFIRRSSRIYPFPALSLRKKYYRKTTQLGWSKSEPF